MQQQHEMRLERTLESGEEEWYCPTCGRRFLLRWPPAYAKEILEPGDEFAIHTGGKGGVHLGSAQLGESEAPVDDLFAPPEFEPEFEPEFVAQTDEPLLAYEEPSDEHIEISDDLLAPWMKLLDRPTNLGEKG